MTQSPISAPARPHAPCLLARLGLLAAGLALAGLAGCTIPIGGSGRPEPTLTAAAVPPPAVNDGQQQADTQDRGPALTQALTFRGVIPCADCAGQRITLTLFPDWTYRMRRVYLSSRADKASTTITSGTWERLPGANERIRLSGTSHDENQFEVISPSTLRLLDQQGDPIHSMLNYELTQQFELDPIQDH